METIVFAGDSITFGYGLSPSFAARLTATWPSWNCYNEGVGGAGTDDWIGWIASKIEVHYPTLVVLFLGTNDAQAASGIPGETPTRVPLLAYESNMRAIITGIMAAGSKAILVTPPPVNEANTHYGYTTASVTNYAQVVRDLAEEYGFPMLDVFASVIADAGNPTKYADWFSEADGIHLSQQGHDWIAGQLVTAIPATLYPNNILAGASFIGAGL